MSPRSDPPAPSWRGRALDTGYRRLLRPVLFGSYGGDAERVHEQTLTALERVGNSRPARRALSALTGGARRSVTVAGIDFPGVVGVAAGLDKNGLGLKAWSSLGFGHAELGTVTAAAQPGNPKPRLFRLRESQAIINRMGFNNLGAAALAARLQGAGVQRGNGAVGMPIGVSIGKTKTTPITEATEDYLSSFRLVAPYADYVAINVSSPNTPCLRTLQDHAALQELVVELVAEAQLVAGRDGPPVPLFVKIAPDLTNAALDELLEVCLDGGAAGLIATNTTLSRDGIDPADAGWADQAGGLSGAPLTVRARQVVRYVTSRTDLPVIGVGGILTTDDANAMLDAGARLLQIYTGYIYAGPALISSINQLTARSVV